MGEKLDKFLEIKKELAQKKEKVKQSITNKNEIKDKMEKTDITKEKDLKSDIPLNKEEIENVKPLVRYAKACYILNKITKKDSASFQNRYKYASLNLLLNLFAQELPKLRIWFKQELIFNELGETLVTTVFDVDSGEVCSKNEMKIRETSIKDLEKKDGTRKMQEIQALGSNYTYQRRYSFLFAFGIFPDDDDDGIYKQQKE